MNLSNDKKEDTNKTTPSSQPTLPNHEIVSMKEEENAKSGLKDKYFFIVKSFLTKMSGKKSEPQEQKETKTPIDENLTLNGEENDSSALTYIDHSQIWRDCCNFNFKKDFKWGHFWMNMLLGLAPCAFDIGTDFKFASNIEQKLSFHRPDFFGSTFFTRLSLLCIALPGLVYVPILLNKTLERCTKQCNSPSLLTKVISLLTYVISTVCSLGLIAAIISGLYILVTDGKDGSVLVCQILAGIVATLMLGIKTLPVFVHTESVKKLALKASNYEGSYESSLQLLLNILLWVIGFQDLNRTSTASSLVMIAKSGAENFLTFGAENKLSEERSLLSKLRTQAKFIPVFLLTGFFRVGTLALIASLMVTIHFYYIVTVPFIVLGLPLVVFLLRKMCRITDLSVAEIGQGLLGEGTSIVLWGSTGREGSRKIQLWVGGYLLVLYTAVLVVLAVHLSEHITIVGLENLTIEFIIILLASGWIGYGLFIYQVFLFNRYNVDWRKKVHYMGSIIIY